MAMNSLLTCYKVVFMTVWVLCLVSRVFAVNCRYKQGENVFGVKLPSPAELTCEHKQEFEQGSGGLGFDQKEYLTVPQQEQRDSARYDVQKLFGGLGDLAKLVEGLGDDSFKNRLHELTVDLENEIDIESGIAQLKDDLLHLISGEIVSLSHNLNSTKAKLQLRESQLKKINNTLGRTQSEMSDTSTRLLKTEIKLTRAESKRKRLDERLQESEYNLDETREKLLKLQDLYQETHTRLSESNTVNRFLEGRVEYYSTQLNYTDIRLRATSEKYKNLLRDHRKAVRILTHRERQLRACLKSKTNQFCGFEHKSLCGFTLDPSSAFNWTRLKGPTPSLRTGPDIDHTCLSERGHYMYIEASSRLYGQTARMISPKYLSVDRAQCVEFYYHMYGSNCGSLNVYVQVDGVKSTPLWRIIGNQGDVWTLARFVVPRALATKGYKVIFEGAVENGYMGDIAMDDVKIYDGQCPTDRGRIVDMYKIRRDGLPRT